jgi:hypothetical protein
MSLSAQQALARINTLATSGHIEFRSDHRNQNNVALINSGNMSSHSGLSIRRATEILSGAGSCETAGVDYYLVYADHGGDRVALSVFCSAGQPKLYLASYSSRVS